MAYQIKSTPFFRRMLSTSTRNGDLQKLKDEYERIKGFDDHGIEKKMREVRLKRLFKEIDDIRESDIKKQRLMKRRAAAVGGGNATTQVTKRRRGNDDTNNVPTLGTKNDTNNKRNNKVEMRSRVNQPMTPWLQQRQRDREQKQQHQQQLQQQQRQQRQQGQKWKQQSTICLQRNSATNLCKNNARPYNSHSKMTSPTNKWYPTANNNGRSSYDDDKLSKARVVRRTTYGNQISSWNMQKMLMQNLRKDVKAGINETKHKCKRLTKKSQKSPKTIEFQKVEEKIVKNPQILNKISESPIVAASTRSTTPVNEASSKTLVDEEVNKIDKTKDKQLASLESSMSVVTLGAHSIENMYSCQSADTNALKRIIDIRTIDCADEFCKNKINPLNYLYENQQRQQQWQQQRQQQGQQQQQQQQQQHQQLQQELKHQQSKQSSEHRRAKSFWNKLAKVVNNRIKPKKCLQILETLEECHNDLENQLRTISNVTNLPQSQIIVQQDDELNLTDPYDYDEDDDICKAEVLIRTNAFFDYIPKDIPSQLLKNNNNYNKFNHNNNDDDDDAEGEALAISTGTDTTGIYEDAISKHSHSYQQMSIIMGVPPPAPPLPIHLQKDFSYNPYILAQQIGQQFKQSHSQLYAQPPPQPLSQPQPQPQPQPQAQAQAQAQLQLQHPTQCEEMLRKFEALSRETIKKEINEYSVQRLRDIFEHRH